MQSHVIARRIGVVLALGLAPWALAVQDQGKVEAAPQSPPTQAGAPKVVLSSSEWDFGTKWYGEPAETSIAIKNEGAGPLTIVKVRSSCGCTVAKPADGSAWNGKVIQPGASEEFKLTYNTKKNATNVSQTVTIETNDPAQPSIQIRVHGTIKRAFDIKPEQRVVFRLSDRDAQDKQELTLTSNLDEKVQLKLDPLPADAVFDAKVEESEPGKEFKVTVTTKPPLKPGFNSVTLRLTTSSEKNGEVTIPVTAYITPRVRIYPTTIPVSPKIIQPIEPQVRVAYQPEKPVKVTKIETSSPLVKAELAPPPAPAEGRPAPVSAYHEINVTIPAAKDLPEGGVTITIFTDDPAPEYAKLEVKVIVRDLPARSIRVPTPETNGQKGEEPAEQPGDNP